MWNQLPESLVPPGFMPGPANQYLAPQPMVPPLYGHPQEVLPLLQHQALPVLPPPSMFSGPSTSLVFDPHMGTQEDQQLQSPISVSGHLPLQFAAPEIPPSFQQPHPSPPIFVDPAWGQGQPQPQYPTLPLPALTTFNQSLDQTPVDHQLVNNESQNLSLTEVPQPSVYPSDLHTTSEMLPDQRTNNERQHLSEEQDWSQSLEKYGNPLGNRSHFQSWWLDQDSETMSGVYKALRHEIRTTKYEEKLRGICARGVDVLQGMLHLKASLGNWDTDEDNDSELKYADRVIIEFLEKSAAGAILEELADHAQGETILTALTGCLKKDDGHWPDTFRVELPKTLAILEQQSLQEIIVARTQRIKFFKRVGLALERKLRKRTRTWKESLKTDQDDQQRQNKRSKDKENKEPPDDANDSAQRTEKRQKATSSPVEDHKEQEVTIHLDLTLDDHQEEDMGKSTSKKPHEAQNDDSRLFSSQARLTTVMNKDSKTVRLSSELATPWHEWTFYREGHDFKVELHPIFEKRDDLPNPKYKCKCGEFLDEDTTDENIVNHLVLRGNHQDETKPYHFRYLRQEIKMVRGLKGEAKTTLETYFWQIPFVKLATLQLISKKYHVENGYGLYAGKEIPEGTRFLDRYDGILMDGNGLKLLYPNGKTTFIIGLGNDKYLNGEWPSILPSKLTHSDDPNCEFYQDTAGDIRFRTIRSIVKDEQLTVCYRKDGVETQRKIATKHATTAKQTSPQEMKTEVMRLVGLAIENPKIFHQPIACEKVNQVRCLMTLLLDERQQNPKTQHFEDPRNKDLLSSKKESKKEKATTRWPPENVQSTELCECVINKKCCTEYHTYLVSPTIDVVLKKRHELPSTLTIACTGCFQDPHSPTCKPTENTLLKRSEIVRMTQFDDDAFGCNCGQTSCLLDTIWLELLEVLATLCNCSPCQENQINWNQLKISKILPQEIEKFWQGWECKKESIEKKYLRLQLIFLIVFYHQKCPEERDPKHRLLDFSIKASEERTRAKRAISDKKELDVKNSSDKRQAEQKRAREIAETAGNSGLTSTILKIQTKQKLSDTDLAVKEAAQTAIAVFSQKEASAKLSAKLYQDAYDPQVKKQAKDIAEHFKRPQLEDQIYRKIMGYNTTMTRGDVDDQEIASIITEFNSLNKIKPSAPPPGGQQAKKRKKSTSGTSDAKQVKNKRDSQKKRKQLSKDYSWAVGEDSFQPDPLSTTTKSSSDHKRTTCNLCVLKGLKWKHVDDEKCSRFCKTQKTCLHCSSSPHLMYDGEKYIYYCAKCWPVKFNWVSCVLCSKGNKQDGTPWCTSFYEHCVFCDKEGYIAARNQQPINGKSQLLERDDGEWQCEPPCTEEEK